MTIRVLVLDADQRAALAVARSLGRRKMTIVAAGSAKETLAGASRFSTASLVHPDMQENPDGFLCWLDEAVRRCQFDILLPITEVATDLVVRNRNRWEGVRIPFAPIEVIDALSDKVNLYGLARRHDVPVPRSVVVRGVEDLQCAYDEIGFPCVLKPHRSRLLVDGRWVSTVVRTARSRADVEAIVGAANASNLFPLLYQEFIPGNGAGLFTLYREGKAAGWFAHRRLREKPPGGGVSVLSESVSPSEALVAHSRKLLDAVGWEGVAMVEYRVDPEGRPWLMEVNARFWGSLQLAIDAGADFPAWLVIDEPPPFAVREGARLHWVLGDLDRLWLVAKSAPQHGKAQLGMEIARFAGSLCNPWIRSEVFRWSDPKPGLHELKRWCAGLRRA